MACVSVSGRVRSLIIFICLCSVVNVLWYLTFVNTSSFKGTQRNVYVTLNQNYSVRQVQFASHNASHSQHAENDIVSHKLSEIDEDVNEVGETATTMINPHDYNYLINEPDLCNDTNILVVVVVCTGVKQVRERTAIRNTWGQFIKDSQYSARLVFFLGMPEDSRSIQMDVLDESGLYRDIIQEDFIDSYRNLSVKSVGMLKWASTFCSSAKYILKSDDDMFINIPNLVSRLKNEMLPRVVLGHTFVGARPIQDRRSKWHTPKEDFSEMVYPNYVSGTSYVVSMDIAYELYEASLSLKLFWLEDIYITGMCIRKISARLVHEGNFHFYQIKSNGCAYKNAITGHRVSIANLYKIYKELIDPKLKCK